MAAQKAAIKIMKKELKNHKNKIQKISVPKFAPTGPLTISSRPTKTLYHRFWPPVAVSKHFTADWRPDANPAIALNICDNGKGGVNKMWDRHKLWDTPHHKFQI